MTSKRRSFLIRSTWAAPALVGLGRAFGRERREGKLGVALIGLGNFSRVSIAPELPLAKNVYLAGVVTGDPSGKGREWARKYGFPEANVYSYDQFDRLAENREIDLVHVVTPNGLHARYAIASARAGKHVMCEKPMATSTAECQAMIDAAKQAGVYLGVSYRLHFEPHHRELIRLMKERTFGPVKALNAEFSWRRGDNKPWLLDKKLAGGGALFDTGVYPIQAACYTTGESPTHASGVPTTTRDVYPSGIEETMSFTLEFPGGAVAQGRASYSYAGQQLAVGCDQGIVSCTAGPTGGSVFGQSANGKPNPKQLVLPRNKIFKVADTLELGVLLDEFAAAIRDQRPFACPGEMGLRDIRIVEAIYRSVADGGRRVSIHPGSSPA